MAPEGISRLLTLPLELRLQIYELVWAPLTVHVHSKTATIPPRAAASTTADSLSLLRVCRQIYAEALRTAFSRHTFLLTRSFSHSPLHTLHLVDPHTLITSLLLPAYRPPSHCPTPVPERCYNFKEICSLVRRFRRLSTIFIVADQAGLEGVKRAMRGRRAHVVYRMKKARRLSDDRFCPSYNMRELSKERKHGKERDVLSIDGWTLNVAMGDGTIRNTDLLLCALEPSKENEDRGLAMTAGPFN